MVKCECWVEQVVGVKKKVEGCRVYTLHPTLRTIKKNNKLQIHGGLLGLRLREPNGKYRCLYGTGSGTEAEGVRIRGASLHLGVFEGKWLHSVWEDALLGPEIDMDIYGVFKRTPTDKKRACTICSDRDHHARICPVWNHPAWPEALRQRREDRIKEKSNRGKAPAAGDGEASRGRDRGQGSSSRGRGGYHAHYGPPPPPPHAPGYYGYAPGYYAYEHAPRGSGRGKRGRGNGQKR
ncbi:hypothetical protein EXIGLDRAFT_806929 [Exidia glandulosa HHB12029]|uniref:Uncharacterized protein n=1 Tax=Exidia glandulosa HHB12029 TaxID=1314781 RepID=A0A165M1M6_EXIGL|nr:hypothetical protein EXIGLDRAFT_806929 [Exidia glandulosa HHB12029]